jgi:glyoxylase-like metal-dependent hydrolase (beta-lactamase superfamily II)
VWLPAERILATGDAAVNGPRNKLLDAYIENWPKCLEKAIALKPEHVLPGHGDAGGIEILTGAAAVPDRSVCGGEGAGGRGKEAGGDDRSSCRAGPVVVPGEPRGSAAAGH